MFQTEYGKRVGEEDAILVHIFGDPFKDICGPCI